MARTRFANFSNGMALRRRDVLAMGVGLASAGLFTGVSSATEDELKQKIADFTAGATPAEGGIEFDIPALADNGGSVPVTITVKSPMMPEAYVASVMIGAPRNPFPVIATFNFTPASGTATVTSRIRLAETQTVTAVAKMSDGKCFIVSKKVEVTAGGCG